MRKLNYLFLSVAITVASFSVLGAAPAFAVEAASVKGKAIFSADGKRIGAVYKVASDGSPQVIVNGKLVTIPADTVTTDNGKVATKLTRKEVMAAR